MTNSSPIARLLARYSRVASRHSGKTLLVFFAFLVLAAMPVRSLQLVTDMAELLPTEHPSVKALRRIAGRQKSATNMVMIIDPTPPGTGVI